MSTDEPARVLIRSRFWPRFLRWAVGLQLLLASVTVPVAVIRGLNGVPLFEPYEVESSVSVSVMFAVIALAVAVRRRNHGAAVLTPHYIRPYLIHGGWDWRFRWGDIASVRVKAGVVGNRWLEVQPETGPRFILAARPTDPAGVLDALERFAGPDHPLMQAYAAMNDR